MPLTAASLPTRGLVLWFHHVCRSQAGCGTCRRRAKAFFDVVLDHDLEVACNRVAAQRHAFFAVDEDRRRRRLAGTGQADADVGMFAFARAVDDAAHHGHLELLDTGILLAPDRHLGTQEIVDLLRQFLERGAGRATAARTGRDAGHERAHAQRLQDLGGDHDLLGPGLARRRRQRHPDRVANALLQQDGQRRRRRHDALGAHAGLGQAQVQARSRSAAASAR